MALTVMRVDSARAAVQALAAHGGARILGGGTLLVRDVNYGDGSIDRLVLPDALGLSTISFAGDRASIGATVTMAAVAAEPRLAFLRPVADEIGGPAVRNMATVGGNLFAPYPYGDFTVALLALEAMVTLEGSDGEATIGLETFLTERDARRGSLVTQIAFRLPEDGAFRFAKVVRRKPHGASVLSIAAVLPVRDGKVAGAAIAYGAMAPLPMRARAAEAALDGKPLGPDAIAAAVATANDGTAPLTDPQASDWYRRSVLPVHLKRLLEG